MKVEAIGLLTKSAIYALASSLDKLWTMKHMGQVCLHFLLCKKATIPLTNPYDPVAARFYIVYYNIV